MAFTVFLFNFLSRDFLDHSFPYPVCLETVGSEESSFYLLPEGLPQAISRSTNILLMITLTMMSVRLMMIEMMKVTKQEGPPTILVNSSAKSIHVSTGENRFPVDGANTFFKQNLPIEH